jgi:4-methylaminobutanoate oxidase (formaldehyde-forming)
MHWSAAIGAEALATRQAAALFDETSFSKIEIAGPGALSFLQRLCDNEMDRAVGRVTYTQMLNRRGGIECDFTVTRLAEERFWIVTGTAFGNHDLGWIRSHAPRDGSVQLRDLTAARACLGIWGPAARDVVGALTDDDLGNDAFPYMTAREISVGHVPVLALRVTYVGELGWELYCPTEYGLTLWDELWRAGQRHGLVAGGYRAIDSLRLEKGYRVWSSDITPEDTPYQAGLGFAVRLKKAGGFIGQEALAAAGTEPDRRLGCLVLDEPLMVALGNEPIRVNGEVTGRVTSGGYGYAVARSIAYGYLPAALSQAGQRVEVEIGGSWVGGEVATEPLHDPDGGRVRS